MKVKETLLNACIDKIIEKKHVYSTVMRVESGDGSFAWTGARGEMKTDSSFFIASVTKMYVKPLGLQNTYLYQDPKDTKPIPFYHAAKCLWLPLYMASIGPEGGIVSTAQEMTSFARAFFSGALFPKESIESLKQWRMLLPPPGAFYFGIGLEKQPTPWILSPRKPIREIVGIWGQTSSYIWYNPDTDLYFSGTANQANASGHAAVMNAIIKIIKSELV